MLVQSFLKLIKLNKNSTSNVFGLIVEKKYHEIILSQNINRN